MKKSILLVAVTLLAAFQSFGQTYTVVDASESPFGMQPLKIYNFPEKEFNITRFGAKQGDLQANSKAFEKAMTACNKAGGGKVVVPAGEWLTGPIHFKSNCELFLSEGAVVVFEDDPDLYLPAVQTSWEGAECMNYSPLLYAFECENIGISGTGTLAPKMDKWREWFGRKPAHMQATRQLYAMCSTDVPVKYRHMEDGEAHMRPHLIHFNRCENIRLENFKVRESPFWTIHLFMCREAWVHDLDVYAHGHNNDGIDIEMTQHVVVENCTFDQGDDAIVIKSGRNQDAWRLNMPTQDVVVRNCTVVEAHCLLGVGSEISGGVHRVYMHDCHSTSNVYKVFILKTNHRRGGVQSDIMIENVSAMNAKAVFEIDTDVMFQWRDIVPTFETRITDIHGITMRNVTCDNVDTMYILKGDPRLPIRDITIENVTVKKLRKCINICENVVNLQTRDLKWESQENDR